jgi:hypothetical protein
MDTKHPDSVMAFDALFTTNHIQMLKLLLSYLDPSAQGHLAVCIKLLELQYTLNLFQRHPSASIPPCPELTRPRGGIAELLEEMQPFCSPNEKEKLQNFKNMYHNFENMQEMMQILEMMQEISPEFFSGSSEGSPDLSNLLSGLGGTDISQMIDMLQNMFSGNH